MRSTCIAEKLEGRVLLSTSSIASGETKSGSILLGEIDTFTFSASAGDSITVAMGETTDSLLDPQIDLYAPDGALVTSNWGVFGTRVDHRATQGGTFRAVARDLDGNDAGPYSLSLAKVPGTQAADTEGGQITSGQSRTGSISAGDLDIYRFTASAGDRITVVMGETADSLLDPQVDLYAPDGRLAATNWGVFGTAVDHGATVTGTYYIVAGDLDGNDTGRYGLSLAKVPGPQASDPEGGSIADGQTRRGTIAAGDLDVFTFSAVSGDSITLAMGETADSLLDPQIDLYAPDGTLVRSNWGVFGTTVDYRATQTGTHYAVARDLDGNDSGPYNLTLALIPGVTKPTISIASTDASASEPGSDTGTFTITRTNVRATPMTVNYTVGGSAANGTDYNTVVGSVTIPANSASATVRVTPKDDTVRENPETVVLTLSSNTAYNVDSTKRASTVTIADNDSGTAVSIATTDATASEPGTDTGTFAISRTGSLSASLTVNYTVGGSAINGTDYNTVAGSVTIPANSASATIRVTPKDDTAPENAETVIVTLASSTAYSVDSAKRAATVTIIDNDRPALSITATDAWGSESAIGPTSSGAFTISRNRATTTPLTVSLGISGSAALNTDYRLVVYGATASLNTTTRTLTLTLAPGSGPVRIIVEVLNDAAAESVEQVTLSLRSGTGYLVNPAKVAASVSIADRSAV